MNGVVAAAFTATVTAAAADRSRIDYDGRWRRSTRRRNRHSCKSGFFQWRFRGNSRGAMKVIIIKDDRSLLNIAHGFTCRCCC